MSTEPAEKPTTLLDTLRVGIVMLDGQGDVLLWSPMTEEILGWSAEEIIGRPIQEIIEGGDADRRIRNTLGRTHRWRGIMHLRHRDGRLVEFEGRAALLRDTEHHPFVLANIVETSRVRAVEHDLAALDGLFAASPLGIALFDTEKRFVRFNQALITLNQAPNDMLVGHTVADLLPPAMAEEVLQVQQTVLDTGRPVVDMVMPAPDGHGSRSVSYSRLTDRNGEVLGVSCTIMDITERLEAVNNVEAARERLALLDNVGVALGDRLDVGAVSQALASALVPRFADYSGVLLRGEVSSGGDLPSPVISVGTPVYQHGVAARHDDESVERLLQLTDETVYERDSFIGRALDTGEPQLVTGRDDILRATRNGDPKVTATLDLGVHSLMAVPLRARGIVLGLLVISRADAREPFDHDDLVLAMELADRAGTSLDNARLYARERQGALMLQRSLLPQHVPEPPGVALAYRYVPGSSGTEVGGDWFDVIPLPGGRVAFVVGDVMGHGLHAAVTMGRLRTAVRTLAGLDLPPDELLARVSDISDDLAHGPEDPVMASCLYAVYEPAPTSAGSRCGLLTMASAGHVPPLLVTREDGRCRADALDLPSGTPLGIGSVTGPQAGGGFEAVEREVPEGSVLVLYTDGLVEKREEDITVGIDRVRALLADDPVLPDEQAPATPVTTDTACGDIEEACDALLGSLRREGGHAGQLSTGDDVAVLMARLGGLPGDTAASWSFSTGSYAVRRAREAVRETLREWDLMALEDTGVLLVSELVTNVLRYASGPIGVRMVRDARPDEVGREGVLIVEVSDPLSEPPRERTVTEEQEGGRGIQLVASEARRWGTRHGPEGKTVWFELGLP
ncbi:MULTISPECIES: SpoIIE family protein phosphatase [unclassified Streptomyces]|uniref:SpoIIE family protein phosphatase n=1 Tax=unclassified Streptomyces TaxID=2593676 RepID=UPI002DDAFAC9|nr:MULTISPECIES: SpoIIE family protein phosphatase [unclassified Streptomyces]WSA92587.1 SpoIIE family protein phosphatase [Streptomyces sp. NBC_01795]WSB76953.1 SpoIIE family protein phosphatase [Streptomyces sp. NBC_01775]WSS14773.1 SpoIIE family protein phosphatase [Streptomyces sp. NBC_01186]WSS43609.1 SpoIIE family protein phosphatase [Streptomyces sp. NBC_01187]